MVGNLRNMAIDMGTEVSNQNRQLDRINQKVTLIYNDILTIKAIEFFLILININRRCLTKSGFSQRINERLR